MAIFRVEVRLRPPFRDPREAEILEQIQDLGIDGVEAVEIAGLTFLEGDLDPARVEALVAALLVDEVTQVARWRSSESPPTSRRPGSTPPADPDASEEGPQIIEVTLKGGPQIIEVTLLPGVTDAAAATILSASRLVGVEGLRAAATGARYALRGDLSPEAVERIAASLANPVIQTWTLGDAPAPFSAPALPDLTVALIPLREVDDAGLLSLSERRRLSLDLPEMRAIQAHFRSLDRDPSDVELETLAQTWSEHCVHKTFRALINYVELDERGEVVARAQIDGLLKTFIMAATEACDKPWVRSAFVDNAGIIAFDEGWELALKAETHNRPSALEPFGGANTGVGGVIRDILGVSARPIANTDALCFGPQDLPLEALPEGVLHPRRVADGVIKGIEDYGNKMGIPTLAGAIHYDPGYTANPLVFCGCVGLLPAGSHPARAQVGDLIVCVGGRTGRDGLRGATFSSRGITHESALRDGSAVQIGQPICEKQLTEAILQARDARLYSAITDCGAGGLSSAIGEMARDLGAEIHLDRVPLKYPGLRPWEIWLSEAQERMVLAVTKALWHDLAVIFNDLDLDATILGHLTGDRRLSVFVEGRVVCDLSVDFLHAGLPRRHLQATWRRPERRDPALPTGEDLSQTLLALLGDPNTRSREGVVRRFDHEVQGGTACKPLVGARGHGHGDAAVVAPLETRREGSPRALAVGLGLNPRCGLDDPWRMGWAAVDEAVRNCVAVGADPDRVALLDNFCWGDPQLPDRLGALVQCASGCHDAAIALQAPFVSGKDSLNNEYTDAHGQRRAIPGTLLVHAVAIVLDLTRTATADLKAPDNPLYLVGRSRDELGGSTYLKHHGLKGGQAPGPVDDPLPLYRALHRAIFEGHVAACHDCSEGGLAVAIAEMAIAGDLGARLDLRDGDPSRRAAIAFGESCGRFIVEVRQGHEDAFEAHFHKLPLTRIGLVIPNKRLQIQIAGGSDAIDLSVEQLAEAWR